MIREPAPRAAGRPDSRAAGTRAGELFTEHGRMVYSVCRLLLSSREEAEDAAQQTFLSAHRSMLQGVVPEHSAAWLATIARNECYARQRRRPPAAAPLSESDEGGLDPADVVGQREEIEALSRALAELPSAQRQAVILREFYGLSYREVAAALGLSGSAVESLLFKSRRRLQERLRPIRAASGVLVLPIALRESLAHAIPGFSAAASGGGAAAGGAAIAKIASAPLAAKLAASALALGAAGGAVTVTELRKADPAPRRPAAAVSVRLPTPSPETPLVRSVPSTRADVAGVRDEERREIDARDEPEVEEQDEPEVEEQDEGEVEEQDEPEVEDHDEREQAASEPREREETEADAEDTAVPVVQDREEPELEAPEAAFEDLDEDETPEAD